MRLIRKAPSLVPQKLAVLATQEQALATAIADRLGLPQGQGPGDGPVYPAVCAAAVLSALRVVLDQWLLPGPGPELTPSMAVLGRQIDEAIAELATGLDRHR